MSANDTPSPGRHKETQLAEGRTAMLALRVQESENDASPRIHLNSG